MKKEFPYQDAVISWYENVYWPLVEIIRAQNILDEFPGRTEADLYFGLLSTMLTSGGIRMNNTFLVNWGFWEQPESIAHKANRLRNETN
jgi:hypothetical protein